MMLTCVEIDKSAKEGRKHFFFRKNKKTFDFSSQPAGANARNRCYS